MMKNKFLILKFLTLFFFVNLAIGEESAITPQVLVRFNDENRQKLMNKEVVYKYTEIKGKDGSENGYGEAAAIVAAPIDRCFTLFCDFNKHHLFFPRKKESKVVKTWENNALVYKKFKVYFTTIAYTTLYTIHKDIYQVDFKLDTGYPHDIKSNAGYFKFDVIDENNTLVSFVLTKVETGLKVPAFIQKYITSRDLPDVVDCIRKRIESGGTWVKD
ncbi:MAG: hypothetical protein KJ737_11440 [Proteobacteria bacterium]|nr:hypothetical protein [Pseudomonadota bacterium]